MVALHIKKVLESTGRYTAATFKSGELVLEYLENEGVPDLILMDIMLDGELDGIETSEILAKKYDIPIIFLTALTDQKTIERARLTDPYGYVMKPFNERELLTSIVVTLNKHSVEKKLRESEARYMSTVQSISEMIITIDQNFRITFLNKRAETNLKTSIEDVVGLPIDEAFKIVHATDRKTLEISDLIAEKDWKIDNIQFENDGKNECYFDLVISELVQKDNISIGYLVVFKDVTDKHNRLELEKEITVKHINGLIQGQEIERSRVSKELHDGLGQILSALKINFYNGNGVFDNKDYIKSLIDEAIEETKRISNDLMPLKLNELGLSDCLDNLCRMNDTEQTNIHFNSLIDLDIMDKKIKINVYRVIQEALNNALKHANCTNISVQLNREKKDLLITVEDDGKGFDFDHFIADKQNFTHRGVSNIIDRVKLLEGELDIESSENNGTLISIRVPLKQSSYEYNHYS